MTIMGAGALAGTLGLGKLVAFWDDNGISIDGHVEGWFTDNTPARFEAYGWHVISNVDGHDSAAVEAAITQAKAETSKPTLICCRTVIGYGSPNKGGSHDCHGAPLGDAEIAAARDFLQWPHAPFEIPADIYADWDAKAKGAAEQQSWQQLLPATARLILNWQLSSAVVLPGNYPPIGHSNQKRILRNYRQTQPLSLPVKHHRTH